MRLTHRQRSTIKSLANHYFGLDSIVYLFGSRIDDKQKGGDIDLLIETQQNLAFHGKRKNLTVKCGASRRTLPP